VCCLKKEAALEKALRTKRLARKDLDAGDALEKVGGRPGTGPDRLNIQQGRNRLSPDSASR
jgi:hypothetical protein